MTDYQRIKLQEQDSNNAGSRIPRTFEVEVRGSLVNLCITGDLLTVVGIVKTIQVRSSFTVYIMTMLFISKQFIALLPWIPHPIVSTMTV